MSYYQASLSLEDIKQAAQLIEGKLIKTPTIYSRYFSQLAGAEVFLKLENLQITGSFKPRGAYIKLLTLTQEQREKGIVTMSAGNHAQGVAYFSQLLNIPAIIVMPVNTPVAKIERTEAYGAQVICHGATLSDSAELVSELVRSQGLTLVHPYDDLDVIKGQGTVALEMLTDVPDLDTLIIPVGGGGLASGMAIAAKGLNSAIQLYGVQSTYCPEMIKVLYPQRWFMPPEPTALPVAEGIAVKYPGQLTRTILHHFVTDILDVSDEDIEHAMYDLMTQGKLVAEGAGAAGLAALQQNKSLFERKKVGIVICGGNIDSRILSSLLMRGLVSLKRLVRLKIQIHDAPGALGKCAQVIGTAGGNIFEIYHQRLFNRITLKMVEIEAVVETRGEDHADILLKKLHESGFPARFIE